VLTGEGASRAVTYLQKQLPQLLFTGPLKGDKVLQAADNLEGLAQLASDSELAVVLRDTLLAEVDLETDAVRRGLRYFMAANIDARLGEYQHARAHAVLARDEFKSADIPLPIDVDAFLARIDSISAGG
jgi:hypothetical protein